MASWEPEYSGPPWRWISKHGRPAAAVGGYEDGMPTYETEDGFAVMELIFAAGTANGGMHTFDLWYGTVTILAPEGLVPLHHNPGALWIYRPCLYYRSGAAGFGSWRQKASQQELNWRFGLADMQRATADLEDYLDECEAYEQPLMSKEARYVAIMETLQQPKANEKADALLDEHLSTQQLIELRARGGFLVRGGETGHTYRIVLGNGFERLNPVNLTRLVNYCHHAEYWLPNADTALAQKLALEDPESEREALEGATEYPWPEIHWDSARDRYAADLERELAPV